MNRNLCLSVFIFIFLCFSVSSSAGDKLWVSPPSASLKSGSSASSEPVAELPMNTELTVVSTEGKWYQVSANSGQKGWIYRGKVTDTQPEAESSSDGSLLSGITGGTKLSAADTSRSMRGLSPEAKEYAKMSGTPKQCEQALDKVLTTKLSGGEVENFLKAGKVGEYAE